MVMLQSVDTILRNDSGWMVCALVRQLPGPAGIRRTHRWKLAQLREEKMGQTLAECPYCGKTVKLFTNPTPTVDVVIYDPVKGIVLVSRKKRAFGVGIARRIH